MWLSDIKHVPARSHAHRIRCGRGIQGFGVAKRQDVAAACREAEIVEQTDYRWRREYGGLKVDQARRLKELELANAKLKRLVANLVVLGFRNANLNERYQQLEKAISRLIGSKPLANLIVESRLMRVSSPGVARNAHRQFAVKEKQVLIPDIQRARSIRTKMRVCKD